MGQTKVAGNDVSPDTRKAPSPYVPPLQRTAGQQPPIAANGGLSYMSFDRNGDGRISRAEYLSGPTPIFDAADADHDQVVSKAELSAAATQAKAR